MISTLQYLKHTIRSFGVILVMICKDLNSASIKYAIGSKPQLSAGLEWPLKLNPLSVCLFCDIF